MGGNIVDSAFRRAGTLLGPEGAAVRLVSSFRVQARGVYRRSLDRVWWVSVGSGVRWGVCELDSGCEHLN
jgi:hypothetical protein